MKFKIKNCYGINSHEGFPNGEFVKFDFNLSKNYLIYAPNGVMKTSFAKAFEVYSSNKILLQNEMSGEKCEFKVDGFEPKEVLVIHSKREDFDGYEPFENSIKTVLLNEELKKEYSEQVKEINNLKNDLFKQNKNLKEENFEIFSQKNFFENLKELKKIQEDRKVSLNFENVKFNELFNLETEKLFKKDDFIKNIKEYIEKYQSFVDKSVYLSNDFNYYNINEIEKSLENHNFFKQTKIILKKSNEEITNKDIFKKLQEEKAEILEDEKVKESFDKIHKSLIGNKDLRKLQEILESNPDIILKLSDVENLKKEFLLSHLNFFEGLIIKYDQYKEKIEKISNKAKEDKENWENVIAEFKEKFFFVPFEFSLENKVDLMINDDKKELPKLVFKHKSSEGKEFQQKDIEKFLSTGEKRALYILEVIFKIKKKLKEGNGKLLIIFDDIADSFDYQNKYAIIEYLNELCQKEGLYQIILTHNFDFLRICQSKFDNKPETFFVEKSEEKIIFKRQNLLFNDKPFFDLRGDLFKNKKIEKKILIFLVPFFRNILQYTSDSKGHCETLTKILHKKEGSEDILIKNILEIFKKFYKEDGCNITEYLDCKENQEFLNKSFQELIIEEADGVKLNSGDIDIKNKVILSIATRLTVENILLDKLKNGHGEIRSNQTRELFKLAKDGLSEEEVKVCKRALLSISENIHLNSFAFEPILDNSLEFYVKLYKEGRELLKKS